MNPLTNKTFFVQTIIIMTVFLLFSCDRERSNTIEYLLTNQEGHFTRHGTGVNVFLDRIYSMDSIPEDTGLRKVWDEVSPYDKTIYTPDKECITKELLTKDAEVALKIWRDSPWKNQIGFELFCKYILPYRIKDEEVKMAWREILYNQYHHLVASVKDMKRAFEIVHDSIDKSFHQTDIKIPYTLSVIDLDRIRHGTCEQRCVYEVGVMRALGIPVAIDGLHEWANYSTSGHAWVALVTADGTYTISRGDSVARKYNPIDASFFDLKLSLEENYDRRIDDIIKFHKTSAKVIRNTFENSHPKYNDRFANKNAWQRFANPFILDVSSEYFCTPDIIIKSDDKYGYLCTFKTGADWEPIAYATSDNGKIVFKNMGDSIVYLYGYFKNGRFCPQSNPFLFAHGAIKYLNPNYSHQVEMHINRKYPMTAIFVNYWGRARKGYFAASNDSCFTDSILLYSIMNTPIYKNEVTVGASGKYRYYRYAMNDGTKHNLAEIQFYSHEKLCHGNISAYNVENPEKGFDGDTFTFFEGRKPFWINIDLGRPVNIDKIVYFERNDDNYVVPDNAYELFYYDNGWHTLGLNHSTGYQLDYTNVPSNALYILRNRTKGHEERIFTYENGKQTWW